MQLSEDIQASAPRPYRAAARAIGWPSNAPGSGPESAAANALKEVTR